LSAGLLEAWLSAGLLEARLSAGLLEARLSAGLLEAWLSAGLLEAVRRAARARLSAGLLDARLSAGLLEAWLSAGLLEARLSAGLLDARLSAGLLDARLSAGLLEARLSAGLLDARLSAGLLEARLSAGLLDARLSAGLLEARRPWSEWHVAEVVLYATKAVLHPTRPLFDTQTQQLKPRCVRALRHIFKLCDMDGDGVLNDQELNDFQVACFNTPLQPDEIRGVKKVVEEKLPSGVDEKGLTLRGFLFLHALFIERGRMETTWAVLRKFGYNNQLVMDEAHLTVSFERRADQCVELTDQATDFLTSIFHRFDKDSKGALSGVELEELFATAPCSPWEEPRWARCAESTGVHAALTLSGFMAQWALTTLLEPEKMLAYLHYLGFTADQTDPQVAFRISKRRKHEKRKGRFSRNIFKCVVLGAPGAGKSALLDSLIGQPFREVPGGAKASERMAVAALETEGLPPSKRMVAMLEPEPATAAHLLQSPEDLQTYDVATFVFDSSSPASFRSTSAQLSAMVQMDCEVPCVLVAAKDDAKGISKDLNEEVAAFCTSLNMSLPVSISIKDGDSANIHSRILNVAMHPDEFVPKTAAMRAGI
ncbi:hypothetical protein CYMTET_21764, partial [Cymbomonas tetramitiformis]